MEQELGEVDRRLGELGRRVRTMRLRQGLTLVQVAAKVSLSHSYISQIERGVTRPSMQSLHRVALALGSTAQELLAAEPDGPVSIVRATEGWADDVADSGTVRALVRGQRELQPLEFVGAGREFGAFYEHAGAEFLYVLAGAVEVEVEGRQLVVLGPGDTMYWAGGIRHRWRQLGDDRVRALLVLANPTAAAHGGGRDESFTQP